MRSRFQFLLCAVNYDIGEMRIIYIYDTYMFDPIELKEKRDADDEKKTVCADNKSMIEIKYTHFSYIYVYVLKY